MVRTCMALGRSILSIRGFVELTRSRFGIKRGAFGSISKNDVNTFQRILSPENVVSQDHELAKYNQDWVKQFRGTSKLLVKPSTTREVSEIISHCYNRNLAVVPVGGLTGLVGGNVPVFDEIVLSLERLNKIRSFDKISGALVADAGVILHTADEFLKEHGYTFPLDLGAKQSCQLGGNVSTNAGGLRLLRYGSLHGSVIGIEAVLADGTIFNGLSRMRKDNTGFDLKQLFIGSEGLLGVVTGVSVQCPPFSRNTNLCLLGMDTFEQAQQVFVQAKQDLGEILSSFEIMTQSCFDLVRCKREYQEPLDTRPKYLLLVETRGSSEHDIHRVEQLFETCMDRGIVTDGVLASTVQEMDQLWAWRENIPLVANEFGLLYTYDVSVPVQVMYDLVEGVEQRMKSASLLGDSAAAVVGFGHMGDGNLHLCIAARRPDQRLLEAVEPFLYAQVQKHSGSISAEHGVGVLKKDDLHYSRGPEQIELMRKLKKLYDPKGILNPYKVI